MELEDIVNEEMLTTEDVNNMLEHTDKRKNKADNQELCNSTSKMIRY